MKPDRIVSAKIVKLRLPDINPALGILTENRLEEWSYSDFLSEIQSPDSLVLVGKIKTKVVGFCIARLIKPKIAFTSIHNIINNNSKMTSNNLRTENFIPDLIYPEIEVSDNSQNFEAECEIYNIAVKEEFQNRGIGNKLLNKIVLLAKKHNSQSIWLEVRNSNSRAIRFYQKNDFRQIYERKNFYSNPLENAIVMKRDL